MQTIELLYVAFSITVATAGLSMVAFAVRAYNRTSRQAMFHLSVGFALIVAAAITTTVSAFLNRFEGTRTLLAVNYLITTIGYLFVIYSITTDQ
jgi:hypothetical protein